MAGGEVSLAQLLAHGTATLRAASVPGPQRDARVILSHVAGIAQDRLTFQLYDIAPPDVVAGFEAAIARRTTREPVSHIIGRRLFWGHWFEVTADVLDPRPETETLVEQALAAEFAHILDLGTGSGAILGALLAQRPSAQGVGTDLSPAALAVARRNMEALGLADRVVLTRSDWFAAVSGSFDLIVSNPPYIAQAEMAGLEPELRHEPQMALTDGADGIGAYRAIARDVAAHLAPGGRLLLEIGPTQGAEVASLLQAAGLRDVTVWPDLDGRDRVVDGRAARGGVLGKT